MKIRKSKCLCKYVYVCMYKFMNACVFVRSALLALRAQSSCDSALL